MTIIKITSLLGRIIAEKGKPKRADWTTVRNSSVGTSVNRVEEKKLKYSTYSQFGQLHNGYIKQFYRIFKKNILDTYMLEKYYAAASHS